MRQGVLDTEKKSSSRFGATGPGEGVMALAAAEGAEVEAVVFVEGSTMGSGVGTSDVPVDTDRLVFG